MTLANVTVVKLRGRALEAGSFDAVDDQLARSTAEEGQDLHLDLGGVQYVCSTGLGQLIALHKKAQSRGGHLTLVNVNDLVFHVLDVSRLTQLLDVRRQACPDPEPTRPAHPET